MGKWQEAHGLFAYELASGALVGLVITGVLTKTAATKLINDSLDHLLDGYPDLEKELRQVAAKATAQVEILAIEADRLMKRP